jgi:hypothetical protein
MHCSVIFACSVSILRRQFGPVSQTTCLPMLIQLASSFLVVTRILSVWTFASVKEGVGYLRLESSSLLEDSYLYIYAIRY